MILVATQTPRAQTAWALGMMSSGIMAGNLAGPLIGGALPPLIGIRRFRRRPFRHAGRVPGHMGADGGWGVLRLGIATAALGHVITV
jgi:hypothetical protein